MIYSNQFLFPHFSKLWLDVCRVQESGGRAGYASEVCVGAGMSVRFMSRKKKTI